MKPSSAIVKARAIAKRNGWPGAAQRGTISERSNRVTGAIALTTSGRIEAARSWLLNILQQRVAPYAVAQSLRLSTIGSTVRRTATSGRITSGRASLSVARRACNVAARFLQPSRAIARIGCTAPRDVRARRCMHEIGRTFAVACGRGITLGQSHRGHHGSRLNQLPVARAAWCFMRTVARCAWRVGGLNSGLHQCVGHTCGRGIINETRSNAAHRLLRWSIRSWYLRETGGIANYAGLLLPRNSKASEHGQAQPLITLCRSRMAALTPIRMFNARAGDVTNARVPKRRANSACSSGATCQA